MTLKLNGTNSVAAPAYAGDDADTGLQCGTDELKLVTGGTARATVDSSGNLGVGTTSPDKLFHVESSSFARTKVSSTAASAFGQMYFGDENKYVIGYRESHSSQANELSFKNIDSNGLLTFHTGASERLRIQSAGGISFNGDTAATNALNDYEEGDWTPSMNNGGWTGFTILKAKYIKIGALVFVQCFVGPLTGSGDGSALKLEGLPFNSITQGYSAGTVDFGEGGVKGNYCRTESNDDKITFFYPSENNSQSRNVLLGNQIGDAYIIINLTYFTDA